MEPVGQELGIVYKDDGGVDNNNDDDDDPSHRDFFAQGPCDDVFLQLIQELGWIDDLVLIQDQLPPKSQKLLKEHLEEMANNNNNKAKRRKM